METHGQLATIPALTARVCHADSCLVPLPQGPIEQALQAVEPEWQQLFARPPSSTDPKGSPTLLLVASSALRAAHLLQLLPTFRKVGFNNRHRRQFF